MTGRWVYKLTCTNCNKCYIGRTNRNFKARFKEHRKDFRYAEDRSNLWTCPWGRTWNENNRRNMSLIHLENNHRKINTLEEVEILKVASSKYLLNDVIAGQNDPMYKLLRHQSFELQDQQPRPSYKRKFETQRLKKSVI
jgi:GIY-YIG catalytic domain.